MKSFRGYRLDTVNHCLWRGDERLSLAPKAFDVLRYLVEHCDRLVTQEEILEALWPDTYVNPEVVKKYVLGIRKALGDDSAKPAFVATFPRRGYQFIAAVDDEPQIPPPQTAAEPRVKTIVGRDNALARLQEALAKAQSGDRQIVFLTGEAGIGKTTLVGAFEKQNSSHSRTRIARGYCIEGFGGKEAYYPVLDCLGQLLRGGEEREFVQALARQAPTWLVQFPHLVDSNQREAIERQVLGASRERMVREICEALENITARDPLVMCLEDLHWVDRSTLDFLSAVARRRTAAKLLIIATYRPVDAIVAQSPLPALKQDLVIHDLAREIGLELLEESDVAQYIEAEFPKANFPAALAPAIYRQSGGNALFMVAILQDLLKKQWIAKRDGQWTLLEPLPNLERNVPDTLDQLIEAQFQQLTASEQRVLRAASVAGEQFSLWAINDAAELDAAEIEKACEGLAERLQFIGFAGVHELANGHVSAHYDFQHSFYREVLYRRLSEVARARLHLLLAKRMQAFCDPCEQELATELAMHFESGHDYEQAIRYLILAAENSTRLFSYRDSINILEQARELATKLHPSRGAPLEVRVLEKIGDAHFALGDLLDSAQAYTDAASRAATAGNRSDQAHALVRAMYPLGAIDPKRGLAAMRQAVQTCERIGDARLTAQTQMLSIGCHLVFDEWRQPDADVYVANHSALCDSNDSGDEPLQQMVHGHVLSLCGKYREAIAAFESSVSCVDPSTGLITSFGALSGKTFALLRLGELGQVLRIVRAGKESFEENRTRWRLLHVREAWLRLLAFDYPGTVKLYESISHDRDQWAIQPRAICEMAEGYMAEQQQDFPLALAHFSRVHQMDPGTKFFLSWLWRITAHLELGNVWLRSGDTAKSKFASESVLRSALSVADPHIQVLAWDLAARLSMAESEMPLAQERIEKAIQLAEQYEIPLAAWRAYATASEIFRAGGENDQADWAIQQAEDAVVRIANSFDPDEPLRATFLSGEPLHRICRRNLKSAR